MYNYDQARVACKEYSYLIGSQVSKGFRVTGTVNALIPAPLDGINRHRFLVEYRKTRNVAVCLRSYKGPLYTVLLVGTSLLNPHTIFTIDLERYLAQEQLSRDVTLLEYC